MTQRRAALIVPVVGITLFVLLMAVAIVLYPGGSRFHPEVAGYSTLDNFWCDLFDTRSYSGVPNPGRALAIAATAILPASLIPLWLYLPAGLDLHPPLRVPIAVLGTTAMLGMMLISNAVLHDLMILSAGPAGFAAYTLTLVGLRRAGRLALASAGLAPLAFSSVNFVMWFFQFHVEFIPVIQKLALLAFLVWLALLLRVMAMRPAKVDGRESPTVYSPEA